MKTVVALDVDGVLLDWFSGFIEYLAKVEDIVIDPNCVSRYDMSDLLNGEMPKYVARFNSSFYFGQLRYTPFALDLCRLIAADDSLDPMWISACLPAASFEIVNNVAKMRDRNLREASSILKADRQSMSIAIGRSKYDYLPAATDVVAIDDSPDAAWDYMRHGVPCVLVNARYNAGRPLPNLSTRCDPDANALYAAVRGYIDHPQPKTLLTMPCQ